MHPTGMHQQLRLTGRVRWSAQIDFVHTRIDLESLRSGSNNVFHGHAECEFMFVECEFQFEDSKTNDFEKT